MTNLDRIKAMDLEQMAAFLNTADDQGIFCSSEGCRQSTCIECIKNYLLKDCGDYFENLKNGDKFKVDKNIYIKVNTFYLDNPNDSTPFSLICNAVNLKTGLPVYFDLDKMVFKKKLEEVDFND